MINNNVVPESWTFLSTRDSQTNLCSYLLLKCLLPSFPLDVFWSLGSLWLGAGVALEPGFWVGAWVARELGRSFCAGIALELGPWFGAGVARELGRWFCALVAPELGHWFGAGVALELGHWFRAGVALEPGFWFGADPMWFAATPALLPLRVVTVTQGFGVVD